MGGITLSAPATALALVLLYTNWPVVAAQRGVLPSASVALVPILLAVAAGHQIVIRRRPIVIDRTLLLMMGYLCVLLVSSFAAQGYDVALERILVFVSEGLMIVFLIRQAVRSLPDLRVVIVATVAAACLLAGLTVFQAATGNYDQEFMGLAPRSMEHAEGVPRQLTAGQEIGLEHRARGPVDEPNRFAQILLMAGALSVIVALNARRRAGGILAWICVGLLLAGVLLTYSRGALVSLLLLLALAVPLRLVRPARLAGALAVCGVLTLAFVPGLAERAGSVAGVAGLFGSTQIEADGPTRGRTTAMLSALAAYKDHPVLGVGPGQYLAFHAVQYQDLPEISFRQIAEPRRAHNLYLEVAAETGTLGLLAFLAIPILLLMDLGMLRRVLARSRPDLARLATGFMLVVVAYLSTGVFLHLAYERYYWVMVALAAATVGALREWVWEDDVYADTLVEVEAR